jgi:hypothetical protein
MSKAGYEGLRCAVCGRPVHVERGGVPGGDGLRDGMGAPMACGLRPAEGRGVTVASLPTGYEQFLRRKRAGADDAGFDAVIGCDGLYDFQREIVEFAARKGRSAIFAECGLGKTPMQLEWARLVADRTGGNVLILAPLAVGAQTVREGDKFGIEATHAREASQVGRITVTNYERLGRFADMPWAGVVLDESSILKAFDGKTRESLTQWASDDPVPAVRDRDPVAERLRGARRPLRVPRRPEPSADAFDVLRQRRFERRALAAEGARAKVVLAVDPDVGDGAPVAARPRLQPRRVRPAVAERRRRHRRRRRCLGGSPVRRPRRDAGGAEAGATRVARRARRARRRLSTATTGRASSGATSTPSRRRSHARSPTPSKYAAQTTPTTRKRGCSRSRTATPASSSRNPGSAGGG